MTNVLYVVGPDPASNNNLPLRYSLRALDKYAHNLGNVYVVGYVPEWLNDKVHKLSVGNKYFGKHWNILSCVVDAVNHFGLKGNFQYSSDDHFFLRDIDLDKWPRFEKGELYTWKEYTMSHHKEPGRYQKSIVATRAMYDAEGLPPVMSCCHMNTWMNADMANDAFEMAYRHFDSTQYGIEPTCAFTAASMKHGEILQFEHIDKDVKLRTLNDIEDAKAFKFNAFSLQQNLESSAKVVNWLKDNYPERSAWEK